MNRKAHYDYQNIKNRRIFSEACFNFLKCLKPEIFSLSNFITLVLKRRFANNMVYVGLSYYGPALGSEEHLSFFFSSLAEIPSYMACWVVMDRWGRRWPLCLCMVVAGASCIATVLLPPGICQVSKALDRGRKVGSIYLIDYRARANVN